MNSPLQSTPAPELIFGLVAPIGVDLELVTEQLTQALREMRYNAETLRLTSLMQSAFSGPPLSDSPYIQSIQDRITQANRLRARMGDDILAVLAISAIRQFRQNFWENQPGEHSQNRVECHIESDELRDRKKGSSPVTSLYRSTI